jgi:hypothetical protein
MQGENSENFWLEYQGLVDELKRRFESLPPGVSPAKRVQEFLRRNLSDTSKKRSELEKFLEDLESKISSLEKRASTTKRKRARLDPKVQELIDQISDEELKEYIILQLFKPDHEVDSLLSLCKVLVDLPKEEEGFDHAFGKRIDGTPYAEELKQLQNKVHN